ncbi:RDD family protein [Gordonia sp. (in: high G+C Gram-positive bacteria)]|uniref:RDD family protein n=1 Tax=Gordonia sp. (in: high G+C Gram-positive bacteria) TaxID=84139 RepID=UPI003C72717D
MKGDRRVAGIVTRVIAAVIDCFVIIAALGIGYLITAFILFSIKGTRFSFPEVSWWFTTTTFFASSFVYLVVCWSITGRTIGNVLMGLRVVRISGRRLHFVQILLRAAAYLMFPFGLFWVALSPRRLSLQDALLRTKVVYTSDD